MTIQPTLTKLREKLGEALASVMPIIGIVLILCFTAAPLSPSVLLSFLLGAAMIVVGIMFFTLGTEISMTPMGERTGGETRDEDTRFTTSFPVEDFDGTVLLLAPLYSREQTLAVPVTVSIK